MNSQNRFMRLCGDGMLIKNTLYKNTLRKIHKSLGRYISLLLIVFIGIGFYSGIKSTAPDILRGVQLFYQDQVLMDERIVSTLGLTEEDVNAIKVLPGVTSVEPSYAIDALEQGRPVRLHSLTTDINKVQLITGRMPLKDNECLADTLQYKVGDTITLTGVEEKTLTEMTFTVVGTIRSALYMSKGYGSAAVGDGRLFSYLFVMPTVFDMEAFTEIYVKGTDSAALKTALEAITTEREQARTNAIKAEANATLEENKQEFLDKKAEGEAKLADAKVTLDERKTKLEEADATLQQQEKTLEDTVIIPAFEAEIKSARKKIEEGKAEIDANRKKLEDGLAEWTTNQATFDQEIQDAQQKLDDAKQEIEDIEAAQWVILDRDKIPGYGMIVKGTDTITKVARIMPIFFILIVMFMASNSMARMILEERSELGTLTSLGYSPRKIAWTYMDYVLSATGIGGVLGFFVGNAVIPRLIYKTFNDFLLPPLMQEWPWMDLISSVVLSLVVMSTVTLYFLSYELKAVPAALLRPVPPKHGQKIMLERIGMIWKNLSFTWKVTMRNIFRYKSRVFMTLVGVAGCTALLVTGFGLNDSISGVAQKQYGQIFTYDATLVLKDDVTASDVNKLQEDLKADGLATPLALRQMSLKAKDDINQLDTFVVVPETLDTFKNYFQLTDSHSGEAVTLDEKSGVAGVALPNAPNGSVIVSERLAQVFKLVVGDELTLEDSQHVSYTLTVGAVVENTLNHYIYITPQTYEKVFGKNIRYNMLVGKSAEGTTVQTVAEKALQRDEIVNVILTEDILTQAINGNKSLDNVILMLVVIAALLVLIVLYNLTSINISERTREIATLKVLGFTDGESNQFIFREAFLLTLMSIACGLGLGIVFHHAVLSIIEGDDVVYFKTVQFLSFLYPTIIILVATALMQVYTFIKMRTIPMVESLKSVE